MKTTATILMMGSAALALTACGETKPPAAEETTTVAPAGDMGEEGEDGAMMGTDATPEAGAEAATDGADELGGTSNPIGPNAPEEVAE